MALFESGHAAVQVRVRELDHGPRFRGRPLDLETEGSSGLYQLVTDGSHGFGGETGLARVRSIATSKKRRVSAEKRSAVSSKWRRVSA